MISNISLPLGEIVCYNDCELIMITSKKNEIERIVTENWGSHTKTMDSKKTDAIVVLKVFYC